MHIPIMKKEVLEALDVKGICVDATAGFGGHSKLILEKADKLIAIDQDIEALRHIEKTLTSDKLKLYRSNFSNLDVVLELESIEYVDSILADIGVSSYQVDRADRGFSYMKDGPLDMRMSEKNDLDAHFVVNEYSEEKLAEIIWKYGEERNSRRIAKAIKEKDLKTTFQLREVIEKATRHNMSSVRRVFQAIRIEVNQELKRLEVFLEKCEKALKPGGRIAIISFHTLEDRIVKSFFKNSNFRQLHKKVITANEEEIAINSRAKSAKLRYAELPISL